MDKISPFQIILMAVFGVSALVGLFIFANFQGFGGAKKPGRKRGYLGHASERSHEEGYTAAPHHYSILFTAP
jgi:hypothetical protein